MIRKKAEMELEPWIDESKRSLIASFGNGIANDNKRHATWLRQGPPFRLAGLLEDALRAQSIG
jgi:hypothetical protein